MNSKLLISGVVSVFAALSAVADGGAALWKDEPAMWCAPKTYEINEPNPEGVRSVVIEGEMYKGILRRAILRRSGLSQITSRSGSRPFRNSRQLSMVVGFP